MANRFVDFRAVLRCVGSKFRNRFDFGSGLIRFRFDFGSLWVVAVEWVEKPFRFRFAFGSISFRFQVGCLKQEGAELRMR